MLAANPLWELGVAPVLVVFTYAWHAAPRMVSMALLLVLTHVKARKIVLLLPHKSDLGTSTRTEALACVTGRRGALA